MKDIQEIMLRLACAALQGGVESEQVYDELCSPTDYSECTLYDIAKLIDSCAFSQTEDEYIYINGTKY